MIKYNVAKCVNYSRINPRKSGVPQDFTKFSAKKLISYALTCSPKMVFGAS